MLNKIRFVYRNNFKRFFHVFQILGSTNLIKFDILIGNLSYEKRSKGDTRTCFCTFFALRGSIHDIHLRITQLKITSTTSKKTLRYNYNFWIVYDLQKLKKVGKYRFKYINERKIKIIYVCICKIRMYKIFS